MSEICKACSPLLLDEIRGRTQEDVYKALRALGITQGSGSWIDAEVAESLLFQGPIPDGGVYHKQLGWVAEFVGMGWEYG